MSKGILILTNNYPPALGGAEKQAQLLAEYLAGEGFEVHVVFRRERDCEYTSDAGVNLHPLKTKGTGKAAAARYLLKSLFLALKLRRKYTTAAAFQISATAVAAALIGLMPGKRIVLRPAAAGEGGDIEKCRSCFTGRLKLKAASRTADRAVAISGEIRKELEKAGFDDARIVPIPNAVDTERIKPADEERKVAVKRKTGLKAGFCVLYTGRMTEGKGLVELLRAWKLCGLKNAALVMVGSGGLVDDLRKMTIREGIEDGVVFEGYRENVSHYLDAADVFVRFSDYEGMSNSVLEAMAAGLPCVVSRIGGNTELIDDGVNGILVDPGNVGGLAEAFEVLHNDAGLRRKMGEAGRRKAEEHFGLDRVMIKWKELVSEDRCAAFAE